MSQKNLAEHHQLNTTSSATTGAGPSTEADVVSKAELTRSPEFIEKMLLYLERKNLFRTVSVSIKIGGNNNTLTPARVFLPLRNLLLKYPLLFSFPIGEEPGLQWKPLLEVRLSEVFHVDDSMEVGFKDPDADTAMLTSVSKFESHCRRKPLWHMVYYSKTQWLTFYAAHCFTDGGSILAYLKEFVEALNHEEPAGEFPHEAPGGPCNETPGDLLFSLETDLHLLKHGISPVFFDRIDFKPSFGTRVVIRAIKLAMQMFPVLVPGLLEKASKSSFFVDGWPRPFGHRSFYESDHLITEESPSNNVTPAFINLAPGDVDSLVSDCRRHKVKLNTYVVFVYLHTIHEMYPDLYTKEFLKITIVASLRNIYTTLSSHNTYLGNDGRFDDGFYSFLANYYFDPNTPYSWDAVKKYHDFLHQTINSAKWINEYYTLGRTMTAETYLDPIVEIRKDDTFLWITNLGHVEVIDHGDSGKFHIEDILFAPSSGAILGTHHVTMCSTTKSGLNIGFSDADPNVKDWAAFGMKLKENLLSFGNKM
ncbi:hypothetical protein JCM33374_g1396 [Metschnikowia sp. JCM 33374]|nr:hypothetical protein JCM33374_g1396 [Metschnikowia sp. JCM 33374]